MKIRRLERDEIETFWTIDRSEVHHNVYRMRDGEMVLTPQYFEIPGWPPGQEHETSRLYECFDRGGTFVGMFAGEKLVGVAVVDSILRGDNDDRIQLKWLYVSRHYRGQAIGTQLFREAQEHARALGAAFLYISATPTENTVKFYLRRGSRLALPPDPELLAEEPDDIHLVCAL